MPLHPSWARHAVPLHREWYYLKKYEAMMKKFLFLWLFFCLISHAQKKHSFTDLGPIYLYCEERVQTTPEFEQLFQSGLSAFQNRDYVQAGEEFAKASILLSNHPLAQFYFALCLFGLEKYEDASDILERAIYFYPPFPTLKLDISELYAFPEDFEHQFQTLKAFVRAHPGDEYGKFLLAFFHYYTKNTGQARLLYQELAQSQRYASWARYFLKALGKTAPAPKNYIEEGQRLFQEEKYLEATDFFIQGHLSEPNQPFLLFRISFGLLALKQFEASAEFLRKGVALYANWGELDLAPENLYRDTNIYQQHLNQLKEYLTQHPKNANLSLLFAFHLWISGMPEEALTAFKYASELNPSDRTSLQMWQYIEQQKKENKIPEKLIPPSSIGPEIELPKNRSTPQEESDWGEPDFRAGQYEKAVKVCVFSTQKFPQNRFLKYQFALTLYATQRYEFAAKSLEAYFLLNPESLSAWKNFYGISDDYSKHYQNFMAFKALNPDNLHLNFLQSILWIQEGKVADARLLLYKLLDQHPNPVAIQNTLRLLK